MGKIRIPKKTRERFEKIAEGLDNFGIKKQTEFHIFNALGKWQVIMTPSAVERLIELADAGVNAVAELNHRYWEYGKDPQIYELGDALIIMKKGNPPAGAVPWRE